MRELDKSKTQAAASTAEHVTYATLLSESKAIKNQLAREKLEQERLAHQSHLQNIHDHRDNYWHQVETATARGSGAGYDEAVELLIRLREVATQFKETPAFQERFRTWVRPHLRCPALVNAYKITTFHCRKHKQATSEIRTRRRAQSESIWDWRDLPPSSRVASVHAHRRYAYLRHNRNPRRYAATGRALGQYRDCAQDR